MARELSIREQKLIMTGPLTWLLLSLLLQLFHFLLPSPCLQVCLAKEAVEAQHHGGGGRTVQWAGNVHTIECFITNKTCQKHVSAAPENNSGNRWPAPETLIIL